MQHRNGDSDAASNGGAEAFSPALIFRHTYPAPADPRCIDPEFLYVRVKREAAGERMVTRGVSDAPDQTTLIEIQGLTKRFGAFTAVDNVSFTVQRGEVLGFLGPNGAGKSTTMRMLAGFMIPTAGTARIQGHDVQTDSVAARSALGFLPEGAPTYPEMSVEGFLRFCARVRGFSGSELVDRIDHALGLTTLQGVRLQPVETLSKGFKRRVGLAQALLHDPPVLVLDEPTDGLDPNQKHEVRGLIERMAAQKAIVISTHILEEVDAVCSRAIIIAAGRIVADSTPAELGRQHPSGRLEEVFRALTMQEAA
jgi:ABC-2 type transport system ATP-binding protein